MGEAVLCSYGVGHPLSVATELVILYLLSNVEAEQGASLQSVREWLKQ